MKHNIIFILLSAVILAFGFYAMDIAELLELEKNDENIVRQIKAENHAVYLSERSYVFKPMEILERSAESEPESIIETTETAISASTAMIKAISRYSDTFEILWGINTTLNSAWEMSTNGYLFIDGWEYINAEKKERLLDCIIDPTDYSIVYLRFYNSRNQQLTANEMNRGLEKLDADSAGFYPNIMARKQTLANKMDEMKYEDNRYEKYKLFFAFDLLDEHIVSPLDHDELYMQCADQYDTVRISAEETAMSELGIFWLAPSYFPNILLGSGNESDQQETLTSIIAFSNVTDAFLNDPLWEDPEYSTSGGRIYQTVSVDGCKLTVIYNVKDDIIEGFFFDK